MANLKFLILLLKKSFTGKSIFLLIGLFVSSILSANDSSTPCIRHVYLTLQQDPTYSITINLHGFATPDGLTIYYDTQPHFSNVSSYPFQIKVEGRKPSFVKDSRKIYHAELTSLVSGTHYYFCVGDSLRSYTDEMSFKTLSEEEPFSIRVVEGGDWENTSDSMLLAKKAGTLNPDYVWLGGDYPAISGIKDFKEWDKWLDTYDEAINRKGFLVPFVMAIGNHEVLGGYNQNKNKAPFYFDYFKQGGGKESFFSLPFGKRVRLFILDSGHVSAHDGEQKEWLISELSKYKEVPFKAALYHVPIFPSLRFAEKDVFYRASEWLAELLKSSHAKRLFSQKSYEGKKHWLPIFDRFGLTVAFEHHDQTLKRTKLLKAGMPHKEGTLYLGDGGWGAEKQYYPLQGLFRPYFSKIKGNIHFFWLVEIEEKQVTYKAIDAFGNVHDHFKQLLLK